MKYQIKIGLAPIRRDVTPRPGIFNWEKAEIRGRRMVKYIEEQFTDDRVSFVDTKGITPVDVLITKMTRGQQQNGSGSREWMGSFYSTATLATRKRELCWRGNWVSQYLSLPRWMTNLKRMEHVIPIANAGYLACHVSCRDAGFRFRT